MEHIHPDDLLAQVSSQGMLVKAWAMVSEHADETASRAVRQFEYGVVERLEQIAAALSDGSWRPGGVHYFEIPKSDGGSRRMTVSSVGDRVVERALLDVLTPVIDPLFSPWSFGYRRGVGVPDAIAALERSRDEGHDRVVRCDVESAFDRIPRARVLNCLAAVCPDSRIVSLVGLLLERLDAQGIDGRGIGQGSALSPLMLNLYLDRCDQDLIAHGFLPIRFADDFAVPSCGQAEAELARDRLVDSLVGLDLALNTRKSQVVTFDEGVDFLGRRVSSRSRTAAIDHERPQRITMYVTKEGAVVRSRGDRVKVTKAGETLASHSWSRLRSVVLCGRVLQTPAFLQGAAERGVDVVMLTGDGGFVGRLSRRHGPDLTLRKAQFATSETELAIWFARAFASGKVGNQRVLLRRQAENGELATRRLVEQLARMRDHISQAETRLSIMGVEGMAAKAYWDWWIDQFEEKWGFGGRKRRPAPAPINSMLSYCYTILAGEALAAAETAGLDPDVGFLHSDQWGRPSLALDLMEEYRPVIADSVVLGILSRGRLDPADFQYDGKGGCRMTDRARKVLLEAYETRMLTPVADPQGGGRATYREQVHRSARRLAIALIDPSRTYRPFSWR